MGIDWEEVYRREESKVFHQGLVSPLAMGAESEERLQQFICYRGGDGI